MQAVILAGGLGTRLRPITYKVPKVLVPVAGKPFIDWLISTLPPDVFDEILLLIGYLGEQVREYCGDGSRYGIPIKYSQEPQPLGTAGALRYAAEKLAETFVLINGDTYIELDYPDLLSFHKSHGKIATMVLAKPYDPSIPPNVRVEPDGRITKYAKNSSDPTFNATDAGVVVFQKGVLSYIPSRSPAGLEKTVFPTLAAANLLFGYVQPSVIFYDMGTPQGLEEALQHLHPPES